MEELEQKALDVCMEYVSEQDNGCMKVEYQNGRMEIRCFGTLKQFPNLKDVGIYGEVLINRGKISIKEDHGLGFENYIKEKLTKNP